MTTTTDWAQATDEEVRRAFAVQCLGWEVDESGTMRLTRFEDKSVSALPLSTFLTGWPGFGRVVDWCKANLVLWVLSEDRDGGYSFALWIGGHGPFGSNHTDPAQAAMRAALTANGQGEG